MPALLDDPFCYLRRADGIIVDVDINIAAWRGFPAKKVGNSGEPAKDENDNKSYDYNVCHVCLS